MWGFRPDLEGISAPWVSPEVGSWQRLKRFRLPATAHASAIANPNCSRPIAIMEPASSGSPELHTVDPATKRSFQFHAVSGKASIVWRWALHRDFNRRGRTKAHHLAKMSAARMDETLGKADFASDAVFLSASFHGAVASATPRTASCCPLVNRKMVLMG